jgi:hypothetical protein
MKTNTFVIVKIIIVLGVFCSCEKADVLTLEETKWKLTAFVNIETGVMMKPEADCKTCYTLTFDMDSTFSGQAFTDFLTGCYKIDYETGEFCFTFAGGIDGHFPIEQLYYITNLHRVQSFTLLKNELRLYYNTDYSTDFKSDCKNYLMYNKYREEENYPK